MAMMWIQAKRMRKDREKEMPTTGIEPVIFAYRRWIQVQRISHYAKQACYLFGCSESHYLRYRPAGSTSTLKVVTPL